MDFNKDKVITTVNAEETEEGVYGYFSNDLCSLREAVNNEKINLNVIYGKLLCVFSDRYEKRFNCKYGTFALFYATDAKLNKDRY